MVEALQTQARRHGGLMGKKLTPADLAKSGSEHGEQCAVFFWSVLNRQLYPELKWMFAIPNGGGRSAAQGSMLKAEGVKGGVADICLPVARQELHGLYIEMKKAKGVPSDVTQDQIDFAAFVMLQGYAWRVAYGWEDAVVIISTYLGGEGSRWTPHQIKVHERVMEKMNAPD